MVEFIKVGSVISIACYIEEYKNGTGLCARLRDKTTNKKVVILTDMPGHKEHLLRFLSAAKRNIDLMPTVYLRDGKDIVSVTGKVLSIEDEEIQVDPWVEGGGYLFK